MSKPVNLTIADVARETGVGTATLRAWEERHGFPAPLRLPGGQRRYGADDLFRIRRVIAERAAGATLAGAIAKATAEPAPSGSFFADLRWGATRLEPQVVSKRTMVALSHAIEDECSARAERAILVGAFQERRFYAQARNRWRDLSAGARRAVAFADFHTAREPFDGPAEVPITRSDALSREWAIVHLAPRSSVLFLGRELPGRGRRLDATRRFELVWTAEPAVVWDAVEAAARLAEGSAPSVARALRADLAEFAYPLPFDPGFVVALTNRMVGYLDRR
jgi:MerR family transcriptional regulator, light-induced transcriptional regulator